jgi:hypothetical protein
MDGRLSALETWREKRDELRVQEAIINDAGQKFTLKKQKGTPAKHHARNLAARGDCRTARTGTHWRNLGTGRIPAHYAQTPAAFGLV